MHDQFYVHKCMSSVNYCTCPQVHPCIYVPVYTCTCMLCTKYGSGQSADCPAQTSDPGFAQPIRGLPACSPPHLFTCKPIHDCPRARAHARAHPHTCSRVHASQALSRLECEVVRAASLCDRAMGHREAFDDWTKNTFLSAKKTWSQGACLEPRQQKTHISSSGSSLKASG